MPSSTSSDSNDQFTNDILSLKLSVVGFVLTVMVYGIHLTLFLTNVRQMHKRDLKFSVYMVLLFIFASASMALQIVWWAIGFIDNANYPGGPFQYFEDSSQDAVGISLTVAALSMNWLADGILLYRFYNVCSAYSRFPRMYLVFSLASEAALIVTGASRIFQITTLGTNSKPAGIAYLVLSLSLHLVLTCLMVRCILLAKKRVVFGDVKHYSTTIRLLLESASLYTFWAIPTAITCALDSPVLHMFLPVLAQLQAIPPLLIISRVAARSKNSKQASYSYRFTSVADWPASPPPTPASEKGTKGPAWDLPVLGYPKYSTSLIDLPYMDHTDSSSIHEIEVGYKASSVLDYSTHEKQRFPEKLLQSSSQPSCPLSSAFGRCPRESLLPAGHLAQNTVLSPANAYTRPPSSRSSLFQKLEENLSHKVDTIVMLPR